jgi:galactokinase
MYIDLNKANCKALSKGKQRPLILNTRQRFELNKSKFNEQKSSHERKLNKFDSFLDGDGKLEDFSQSTCNDLPKDAAKKKAKKGRNPFSDDEDSQEEITTQLSGNDSELEMLLNSDDESLIKTPKKE